MELNLNQENKKYQNSLIFLVALASLEFPPRHRPILIIGYVTSLIFI